MGGAILHLGMWKSRSFVDCQWQLDSFFTVAFAVEADGGRSINRILTSISQEFFDVIEVGSAGRQPLTPDAEAGMVRR